MDNAKTAFKPRIRCRLNAGKIGRDGWEVKDQFSLEVSYSAHPCLTNRVALSYKMEDGTLGPIYIAELKKDIYVLLLARDCMRNDIRLSRGRAKRLSPIELRQFGRLTGSFFSNLFRIVVQLWYRTQSLVAYLETPDIRYSQVSSDIETTEVPKSTSTCKPSERRCRIPAKDRTTFSNCMRG